MPALEPSAPALPRLKICCIRSVAEMRLAARCGASAVGLVSRMPSGPGVIPDQLIKRIAAAAPSGLATFLLTSRQNSGAIIAQQRALRPTTLQLVDRLERGTYRDLRDALPGVGIVQVIHVAGEDSLREAEAAAPHVDALLLDSGNPALAVKELGGTGRVHDWSISRRIRDMVGVPIYLAGGLRAGNVRRALDEVRPYGVDVCSGVRTDGSLDQAKLAAFVAAVT
ncbi:MAG TPA: phosphoribosylanthranilate isomerase [Chloroflexota bacterium]|nr:phosphoribosylanthranilate isomerase [Chloroflexota bacterium]